MAKRSLSPVILESTLQLTKLLAGGPTTAGASPVGVDAAGNVVLLPGQALTATVDLGNTPTSGSTFLVTSSNLVVGTPVTCTLSGTLPSGAFTDEYEMEPMIAYGMVQSPTTLAFTVVCCDPSLLTVGKRIVNYYLG